MANRLILGQNTNTNHGHSTSSPGYGLYISRPGKDVTTCTADELIMNTDNGSGTSLGRIIGLFQIPAITTGSASTTTTVSANSTATISTASIDFGLDLGFFSFGGIAPITLNQNTTTQAVSFTENTVAETISIQNFSTSTLTIRAFVAPRYSSNAFF